MFSENEKNIVSNFYSRLDEIEDKELQLFWEQGYAIAQFDTCFEDFDDDNEEDEYTSFAFKVISVEGDVPIEISSAGYFLVNYHNFPNKIEVKP